MLMIDFLIGRIVWLVIFVAVAIFIAQNAGVVLSVLLAALVMLVIARLAWPTPRR
jgi:hypothetical protein